MPVNRRSTLSSPVPRGSWFLRHAPPGREDSPRPLKETTGIRRVLLKAKLGKRLCIGKNDSESSGEPPFASKGEVTPCLVKKGRVRSEEAMTSTGPPSGYARGIVETSRLEVARDMKGRCA